MELAPSAYKFTDCITYLDVSKLSSWSDNIYYSCLGVVCQLHTVYLYYYAKVAATKVTQNEPKISKSEHFPKPRYTL